MGDVTGWVGVVCDWLAKLCHMDKVQIPPSLPQSRCRLADASMAGPMHTNSSDLKAWSGK